MLLYILGWSDEDGKGFRKEKCKQGLERLIEFRKRARGWSAVWTKNTKSRRIRERDVFDTGKKLFRLKHRT